jgi:Secretion system C-terminal sorting domain
MRQKAKIMLKITVFHVKTISLTSVFLLCMVSLHIIYYLTTQNTESMKKTILFSIALILSQVLQAQQMPKQVEQILQKYNQSKSASHSTSGSVQERGTIECKPDSLITFRKEFPTDSIIADRTLLLYDAKGNETKRTVFSREDVADPLKKTSVTNSTYNALNVLTREELEELNTNGVLAFSERTDYYPKGTSTTLLDSTVLWEENTTTGLAERVNRIVNQYTTTGEIVSMATDIYTQTGWKKSELSTVTLNARKQPTKILEQEWDGSVYKSVTSSDYTYDAKDSLVLILATDLKTNEPTSRIKISYDVPNGSTSLIVELYDSPGVWTPAVTAKTRIDALKRFISTETFTSIFGINFGERQEYFYSGNTNCISFIRNYFSEDGVAYLPIGPTYYYYKGKITDTKDLAVKSAQYFPNPVQDQGLTVVAEQGSRVQLHNSLGQLVLEQETINEQSTLPTAQLNNGTYFLKVIDTNGKVQTAQVIKMD